MIYGKMFDGDVNEVAMRVQFDLYWSYSISRVFEVVARRGRPERPERNLASLSARRIDRSQEFDHRSLQWVHDLVAAQFRNLYRSYLAERPGETEHQHQLRIAAAWSAFLDAEMTRLADCEEYLKAHWDSVDFDGGSVGYDGVERLLRFLLARYPELGRHWVKVHPDWTLSTENTPGGKRPDP